MRRTRPNAVIASLVAALLILIMMRLAVSRASASVASASEVIQLVNQLRKVNGLPPYQVNQALMAAAQSHSEYQASTGSVTHTGQGGSRPRDRAAANGYGGGATVYVSENIAGGPNLSAAEAVSWWQGDNLHLTTMLSPNYQDVGAGVAVSGETVYYTLDVGYIGGAASPPASEGTSPPSNAPQGTPSSTVIAVIPIKVATTRPDGSVVHVVEQGQALWNIAAAYKVSLTALLALNNLTDRSLIYPGDKLLVKLAQATEVITATQTVSASATSPPPSNTPRPTRTPIIATPTAIAAAMLGENNNLSSRPIQESPAQNQTAFKADPLVILIAILVVVGTGLVLLGSLMKRKTEGMASPPKD